MKKVLVLLFLLMASCGPAVCGNGETEPEINEECDDDNIASGDGCDRFCRIEECGNNRLDEGEQCDDGNAANGDGCSAECLNELCGDGVVNNRGTETCDDGNQINGDGCDNNCTLSECGNGILAPNEACDDGNNLSGDGCKADCSKQEICGDGTQDTGEECDDSNQEFGDGCDGSCDIEFCGDGIINNEPNGVPTELCDDGDAAHGAGNSDTLPGACRTDCTPAECGDGVIDPGEPCDDGAANSNTDPNTCRQDCSLPRCGDGVRDNAAPFNEECDDGNAIEGDGCDSNCTTSRCNNGIVAPGEVCFQPENTQPLTINFGTVGQSALADFNEDGFLDLAISVTDQVLIVPGTASSPFFSTSAAITVSAPGSPRFLTLTDLDRDQHADLLISKETPTTRVSVLFGNGNGTFQTVDVPVSGVPGQSEVGFFNQDLNQDFRVCGNGGADGILTLLQDGNRGFSRINTGSGTGPGSTENCAGLASLSNGQVAFTPFVNNPPQIRYLVANPDGTINSTIFGQENVPLGIRGTGFFKGDFDENGLLDIVYLNLFENSFQLLRTISTSTFPHTIFSSQVFTGAAPQDLDVADINKDGHLDVVTTEIPDNNCRIFVGNGQGGFQLVQTRNVAPDNPSGINVGDVNKDGAQDLVILAANGKIIVFLAKP
jgi:cysteine-rich repeat protein